MDRRGTRLGTRDGESILSEGEGGGAGVVLGVVDGDEAAHTELDEVEGEEPNLQKCTSQQVREAASSYH